MPLILPGNVASATAATTYSIANSCRFNAADSAYMQWTPTDSAGTDGQIYTLSFWLKRGLFAARTVLSYATPQSQIMFETSNLWNAHAFKAGGTTWYETKTNDLYRDPSAWYHFVTAVDTTQGTNTNRVKVYVNGVQITSFADVGYPTEDQNTLFFTDIVHAIGRYEYGDSSYFDGYLAEFIGIDGTQYAASDFGEFDSDSPTIWKPKDPSGLTFGDEGFWLDFEDSSALGNDVSGNNNDWTAYNLAATDQGTDTPTNNFCVMNPLDNYLAGSTFAEGNLLVTTPSSGYNWNTGTFGLTSGKWYFEMFIQTDPTNNNSQIGVAGRNGNGGTTSEHSGKWSDNWVYSGQGDMYNNDTRTGTGFAEASANDIMGCYIDLDNNKIYWALNGTLQNSGTGIALDAPSTTTLGAYFPMVGDYYNGSSGTFRVNFGNPIWSLSSGVADANGYGSFEYDPSAGSFDSASKDFLAICTKNLGSDGG